MSAVLTNVYDIWLSHHFIDSVHQLGKSHSLFGSSCGRRSSSSQQDREELTRNLDIPPFDVCPDIFPRLPQLKHKNTC